MLKRLTTKTCYLACNVVKKEKKLRLENWLYQKDKKHGMENSRKTNIAKTKG